MAVHEVKLRQFVKQTISDVLNGVGDARTDHGLKIAPGHINGEPVHSASLIAFEISVTVNTEGGGEVGGLSIMALSGAASKESSNRISFSVPVYFQDMTPDRQIP